MGLNYERIMAYRPADTFDRNRPHLLGLRFGIARQPARGSREQDLEGIDLSHVRSDGHDRDDAAIEPKGRRVVSVVAHHDGRTPLVRFGAAGGLEVDQPDLATQHQRPGSIPSPATVSQAAASPSAAHSSQARA